MRGLGSALWRGRTGAGQRRVRGVGVVSSGPDMLLGPVGAVLHIRPGSVGGGSVESCGNASALNAVEILPCAGRVPVHMGALPLEIDVLGRVRNHAENSESARGSAALECATPPHGPGRRPLRPRQPPAGGSTPARSGKIPTRPRAPRRQDPAGSSVPPEPRRRPSPPHRSPPRITVPGEKGSMHRIACRFRRSR